jgi:hypothetical protein
MWLDRAVKWLLPREDHFFDLLERGAACVRESAVLLVTCCDGTLPDRRGPVIDRIRDVEHEADRADIYALATALERITDDIFATVLQIAVHAMDDLPEGSRELSSLIRQACEAIQSAVEKLRNLKAQDEIRECCKLLNRLESDGDRVFRDRLGAMFEAETDAIRLLKHKEFLEGLEQTLDACDDVGNALETIVIKNA